MADLSKYHLGDRKVVKTNRGRTLIFEAYFPRKSPENACEDIYRVLEHVGLFDSLKQDSSFLNKEK